MVNSTGAISEFWRDFGKTRPHVDPEEIIRTSHGCRTFDVIAKWSPEDAIEEQVTAWEGAIPDTFGHHAKPIPGSVELVKSFDKLSKEATENGKQRWAVVTSGTLPLATKWLKLLSIERPDCFITAEKVTKGKPHPQGYQAARDTLGYHDAHYKVVVFEDAPAGITAGKGAGAMVVGICSTYDPEKLENQVLTLLSKIYPALESTHTTRKLTNSRLLLMIISTLMSNFTRICLSQSLTLYNRITG